MVEKLGHKVRPGLALLGYGLVVISNTCTTRQQEDYIAQRQ